MAQQDLDFHSASHDDLVSGKSPWGKRSPPPASVLTESTRTDVVVIGSGITGALAAERLTALGLAVIVIDREQAGLGSTAASTAMLQWEIDCSLSELSGFYGFDKAAAIYRRSLAAVSNLSQLVAQHAIPCEFQPRQTLYIAGGEEDQQALVEEYRLRQRAALPSLYLPHRDLLGRFGLDRAAALVSPGSAEADPLMLCWALLDLVRRRGARLLQVDATHFHEEGGRVTVETDGPYVIEARHAVLATGYVMPHFVMPELHSTSSSWALSTVPQAPENLWPERALIWEASEPYLYLRTTQDNRIIIGGEDEAISNPEERDARLPEKIEILRQKLTRLWPQADARVAHAWCGAFGETGDGLPLIGRVPGTGRIFAAYGYGGNGITFSTLAAQLAGAFVTGHEPDWFEDFALDRPQP